MNQPRLIAVAAALAVAAAIPCQTLVVPAAAAAGDLPSSTTWPFDLAGAIRTLYVYDSAHFTQQGVSAPIVISRIRVRANGTTASWLGDTIPTVTLDLSTAPLDFNAISATYNSNHGTDRAQVYNGPVAIPAGSATTGAAGPWSVDCLLNPPFLYDPSGGDLTVDWICSGLVSAANTPTIDASSTTGQALARRVYTTAYTGGATGTVWTGESAHALEFTYTPAAGYASAQSVGAGCYDRFGSVYETFTGATFDLDTPAGNSLLVVVGPTSGFTVAPGSGTWFTPTSPDLLLTDDSLSAALTLPQPFQFGPLSTTAVKVCSNGYIWLRSVETVADLSPTPSELLQQGPRIAPAWMDLNPASLVNGVRVGSIHFDVNPATNTPVFTWLNVPEFGAANTANTNTFQVEFVASGIFEIRWQGVLTTPTRAIMTGFSGGLGARDGGSRDISATTPFVTIGDVSALGLAASARPTLGTTIQLTTSNPSNLGVGIHFVGLVGIPAPGFDLGLIGAPGCTAYVDVGAAIGDVISNAVPGLSLSTPFALPNTPALAGTTVWSQSAWLVATANALGVLTSNGLRLNLDLL
jgi:hypothetical protein